MSNTPPPLQSRDFMELHPVLGKKIRVQSLSIGIVSLLLGVLAGFVIVTAGLGLPTSKYGSTVFYVGMGGIAAFFQLFSSITLIGGRSAVREDQLNIAVARKTRRLLVVLWVGVAITTSLALYAFTSLVRGSHLGYLPPISAYLVILCVPIVLTSINAVAGGRLFRPSTRLLHKHGAPPQHGPGDQRGRFS